MTGEQIRQLARMLLPEGPSPRGSSRGLALLDPAFGWDLARRCAEAGLRLPAVGVPPALVRANRFLLELGPPDLNVALAQVINESKPQRDLLRALLICDDATPASIADLCARDSDQIGCFECLFWNCLDRKAERPYIARICQQTGGVAARNRQEGLEDLGLQLLRIAYRTGRTALVLAAAGVVPPNEHLPIKEIYGEIKKGIIASAAAGVLNGKVTAAENPALKSALKMIAANQKEKPSAQKGQPELSFAEGAQLAFDKVVGYNYRNGPPYEI